MAFYIDRTSNHIKMICSNMAHNRSSAQQGLGFPACWEGGVGLGGVGLGGVGWKVQFGIYT